MLFILSMDALTVRKRAQDTFAQWGSLPENVRMCPTYLERLSLELYHLTQSMVKEYPPVAPVNLWQRAVEDALEHRPSESLRALLKSIEGKNSTDAKFIVHQATEYDQELVKISYGTVLDRRLLELHISACQHDLKEAAERHQLLQAELQSELAQIQS